LTHSLKTERLNLSIIKPNDSGDVFETMNHQNVAEIISFMTWPMTREQAEQWCEKSRKGLSEKTEYLFIARDKNNDAVGCVGVHPRGTQKSEIGYWVCGDKQGQGYASEMAEAAVKFAFEHLDCHGVWATAALTNEGSQRVLEKLGLRRNGVKKIPTAKGTELECHIYELKRPSDAAL
jgi:[ribosomal protein S5]-alanine N-acetyltransferase